MSEECYTKILVAKHSPKNGCYAPDGQPLTVKAREVVPQKDHVTHFFVSTSDLKTKSKYGWVKEVEPLTLTLFLERYLSGRNLNDLELEHIKTMLTSIRRLPVGTPVAATYSSRGVLKKVMQLTVHKVFFYDAG